MNAEIKKIHQEFNNSIQRNIIVNNMLDESKKILVLKGLVLGYASIVIDETAKEFKKEFWYKQACEVGKYFTKQKPIPLTPQDKKLLDKKYNEMVALDREYFGNNEGSSYICMITILEYLIMECRDTSLRVKFGHYDFAKIRVEIEEMNKLKGIAFNSYKYLGLVLDRLGK